MKENGNKDKAELRSKRGIDENVAGNRRAVRRSNSGGKQRRSYQAIGQESV